MADPSHADSLHLLGLVYAKTNKPELAIESIVQAVRNNSTNPEYFLSLGRLLQQQQRFDEAFKSYDLALKLKPDFVDAWITLGELLERQKRFDEALRTYSHVLTLDARNAEAANKSGELLKSLHRYDEALARFELLASISPADAEAFCSVGICLCNLNRSEEALPHFRKAIEIDPRHVDAHNNLGGTLTGLLRFDEALPHLEAAIRIKPDFMQAYSNLAVALRGLGRFDEALACFDRAIALNPGYPSVHDNRGHCLEDMLRNEEALSSYRKALEIDPNCAETHWSLAVNRLRAGDLKTGWIESEWRWKCASLSLRRKQVAQPVWLGREPIAGKTLLFHNDQGLGDAIQFCRYASLAARRGARVIVEAARPLRDLLMTLDGVSDVIAPGDALPDFDYHCSLSSLPLAFDTTLDTIPSATPYLSVPEKARDWLSWLGPAKGPRIGLVWSGNPKHRNDHNRSVALEALLPLLDVGAEFISLQKDVRPGDAAILRVRDDIRDAGPELNSFSDTAALLGQLDLLITVDTSVAHLAGALARPAWVLLPRVPDWRWLLDREDSPWYPSLRLFRQVETTTWPEVVQRVKEALREMIAGADGNSTRRLESVNR